MFYSKELPEMMENEVVLSVAAKHGKTPAQVLLRYIVQRDVVVIPKSTNPERLALNIQVRKRRVRVGERNRKTVLFSRKIFDFELDDEDTAALKGQDAGESGRIIRFFFFSK